MADISKITTPDGTSWDVKDPKARGVELTQAEYDALEQAGEVLPDVDYHITDAQAGTPLATEIAMSTSDNTSVAEAIEVFKAKRITTTFSNIHTGMTVDTAYRDVFDLGGFYYIAIKINITTAIGTWQTLFNISEISTRQAIRFFAQNQATTDKAICFCLNSEIGSQTALTTGDWWLIAIIPKI